MGVTKEQLNRLELTSLRVMYKVLGLKRPPVRKQMLVDGLLAYQGTSDTAAEKVAAAYARITSRNGGIGSPGINADDVRAIVDEMLQGHGTKPGEYDKDAVLRIAREVLGQYRQIEIVAPATKPKKLKQVMPAEFERIVQLVSQRVNVMMVGPAGCGKTFLGEKTAEAIGLRFSSISCSAGMSESQLAGWLLPVGKVGTFEYVPSPFVDMYENGGVFLLDEIDAADPNTLTFVNKAIANGSFFIPQRYRKPEVKRHKDFVCMAAANTFGTGADAMYVGRNQLDAATLDRFRAGMVMLDYSPVVEEAIVHPEVLKWGRRIREGIKQNKLRKVMSTRVMVDLTKMVEAYKWGPKEWNTSYFADWKPDEISRIPGQGGV